MENNLSNNNDLTQLDYMLSLNHKIDQYLGKTPLFSSLGGKTKIYYIRCRYRNFGEEEVLIVTRECVDLVIKYYLKSIETKTLNEKDFFMYFMKRGFCKTKCFYFFNRLLDHGGYDGQVISENTPHT